MLARQVDQKLYHDKNSKHRLFVPGELVMTRDFRHHQDKWIPDIIQGKLGPLTFSVQGEDGSMFKCHLDHLRIRIQVAEKQVNTAQLIRMIISTQQRLLQMLKMHQVRLCQTFYLSKKNSHKFSHQKSQYLDLNRNHCNYKHKKDLHCESIHDETVGHQIGSFQVIKI